MYKHVEHLQRYISTFWKAKFSAQKTEKVYRFLHCCVILRKFFLQVLKLAKI
jgi:hypothetical protein